MATRSLVHINNNLMCALDTETTGLNPSYHEIVQLAILPLDNWLEPRRDLPLFDILIRPDYIDRVDLDAMTVSKNKMEEIIEKGLPRDTAMQLFEHWYKKLKLQDAKRIIPLGHNVASFDMPFIREWMGFTMANDFFSGHCNDIMQACKYLNDVADFHCEEVPFPKLTLTFVASKLGIEIEGRPHDALFDAQLAQQCYKKLLSHQLLNPV